jgi:hypothetical protein
MRREHALRAPSGRGARWAILLVVLLSLLIPSTVAASQAGSAAAVGARAARGATSSHSSSRSTTTRGAKAHVTPTKTAPKLTARQLKTIKDMNQETGEELPALHPYTGRMPKAVGRAAPVPDQRRQAPGDFTGMEARQIPFFAGSYRSGVSEPSTDAAGKMRFLTSNWQAARSADGGATWGYVNPFANYAGYTNFCCDQVTVYDASHNRWFWLRQYGDHLELSNSGDLVNWCTYAIFPNWVGLASANYSFDYNHMGLSTNNLFIGSHAYGPTQYEVILRLPIDPMTNCAGFGYGYIDRTDYFAESFVNGAGDIMYWGSDWPVGGLNPGSGFRMFSWADGSGTYYIYDRAIDPFNFESFGTGNCGSADGVVLNWCQRTDSRMSGNGYIGFPSLAENVFSTGATWAGDAVIGFAFNANADGSHPFPYIRRIYFRVSDLAYLGRSENWAGWGAFQYPDMAPNAQGHIGEVWAWGGGTGTTHYYPGWGVTIDDDVNPTQPWAYLYTAFGAGNACLNQADGRRRWGDYLTIHAMSPARLVWVATGFRMSGATNCVTGSSVPQVTIATVIFGRSRDIRSWSRWYNQ